MDLISLHTNISSWMPTMGVAFWISISRAREMFQVKFRPVSYRDDYNYINQDGSIFVSELCSLRGYIYYK